MTTWCNKLAWDLSKLASHTRSVVLPSFTIDEGLFGSYDSTNRGLVNAYDIGLYDRHIVVSPLGLVPLIIGDDEFSNRFLHLVFMNNNHLGRNLFTFVDVHGKVKSLGLLSPVWQIFEGYLVLGLFPTIDDRSAIDLDLDRFKYLCLAFLTRPFIKKSCFVTKIRCRKINFGNSIRWLQRTTEIVEILAHRNCWDFS